MAADVDAIVVGAGHNGLVAANVLAERPRAARSASRASQQAIFRPALSLGRPETPIRRLFLAGASAHPGGGVHGAAGANAARAALRPVPGARLLAGGGQPSRTASGTSAYSRKKSRQTRM